MIKNAIWVVLSSVFFISTAYVVIDNISYFNYYIQDKFDIESSTSSPIVITLIVAIISVVIKLMYDTLAYQINIARSRKLAFTVFKEIEKSCNKITANLVEDLIKLNAITNSGPTICETNVNSLRQVENLDFKLLHADIHFPISLSKGKLSAFNSLWSSIDNLKAIENKLEKHLDNYNQLYRHHNGLRNDAARNLNKKLDYLNQKYNEKRLEQEHREFLMFIDRTRLAHQQMDNYTHEKILNDYLVVPLEKEVVKLWNNSTNEIVKSMCSNIIEDIQELEFEYREIESNTNALINYLEMQKKILSKSAEDINKALEILGY